MPLATAGEGEMEEPVRGDAELRARLRVESVQVSVVRADVDHAVGHRRGGFNERAGESGPELRARLGVEGIQVIIPRADVDHSTGHRRGGCNVRAGESGPELHSRLRVVGIEVIIARVGVDHSVGHRRGGDVRAVGGRPTGVQFANVGGAEDVLVWVDAGVGGELRNAAQSVCTRKEACALSPLWRPTAVTQCVPGTAPEGIEMLIENRPWALVEASASSVVSKYTSTPSVCPKLVPLTVTGLVGGPTVDESVSAGGTMNLRELLTVMEEVVTVIRPLSAPAGTLVVIWVSELTVNEATTP